MTRFEIPDFPSTELARVYEDARIVRSMLEHENTLLNNRITWLGTIQGLLFAGLSFAWDKTDTESLVNVFCLLGILVALSGMTSFMLATEAMGDLFKWWLGRVPPNYQGPDIQGLRGYAHPRLWQLRPLYPWMALPYIFILAWIFVLLVNAELL